MSADELAPVHLVLGEEELLIDRAVAAVVAQARAAGGIDTPVDRMRTGDVTAAELAELLSPSLFAETRVLVFESAAEAGKDAVAMIEQAAADPAPGIVMVVVHSGGGRARALAGTLQNRGATVHPCARIKPAELADFVRAEFRAHGVRVSAEVIAALAGAVGGNVRELAAACAQLAADTGGKVDVAAVRRYYAGNAAVTGFEVAELAVDGDRAAAREALRWAMINDAPLVVLADALADAVHTIARVGSAGRGDPGALASKLGMPPWKIRKAQAQARGWNPAAIGQALTVVAALNADVKGAAAHPGFALEQAVDAVCQLRASG